MPAGALDYFCLRPFVDHRLIDDFDIGDVDGLIDDRRIVDHNGCWAHRLQETPFFYKNIGPRCDDSRVNFNQSARRKPCRRVQRRPTEVAITSMPGNPGWRPLRLRHPIPANLRSPIPTPVMISRPRPWLIADPIPASLGPLPMTIAIGSPFPVHSCRDPAPAIRPNNFPSAIGTERAVKIGFDTNLHCDIRFHRWRLDVHRRRRRDLHYLRRWRLGVFGPRSLNVSGASAGRTQQRSAHHESHFLTYAVDSRNPRPGARWPLFQSICFHNIPFG